MKSRRAEILVGLSVLASLVVLIGGIMWGKGLRFNVLRYPIRVSFHSVGGLEAGSNVLANGVVAGRVTGIELSGGKVYVSAVIDKDVVLYSDAKITLESPTLMAGRVMSIYPGSKVPPLTETMSLVGTEPFGVGEAMAIMQDMTADFKATMTQVTIMLKNLNGMIGDSSFQQSVVGVARHTDEISRTAADMLRDNRAQLELTLDQLSSAIAAAEKLTTIASSRLDSTFNAVEGAAAEISALAVSLRTVADELNNGNSSAGRLFKDDELYVRLNTTLANVDSLVVSIRKNGLRNKIVLF